MGWPWREKRSARGGGWARCEAGRGWHARVGGGLGHRFKAVIVDDDGGDAGLLPFSLFPAACHSLLPFLICPFLPVPSPPARLSQLYRYNHTTDYTFDFSSWAAFTASALEVRVPAGRGQGGVGWYRLSAGNGGMVLGFAGRGGGMALGIAGWCWVWVGRRWLERQAACLGAPCFAALHTPHPAAKLHPSTSYPAQLSPSYP